MTDESASVGSCELCSAMLEAPRDEEVACGPIPLSQSYFKGDDSMDVPNLLTQSERS